MDAMAEVCGKASFRYWASANCQPMDQTTNLDGRNMCFSACCIDHRGPLIWMPGGSKVGGMVAAVCADWVRRAKEEKREEKGREEEARVVG